MVGLVLKSTIEIITAAKVCKVFKLQNIVNENFFISCK
jgi:hypothetical protein